MSTSEKNEYPSAQDQTHLTITVQLGPPKPPHCQCYHRFSSPRPVVPDAVIYVWGNPTPCRPVLCNDASMIITEDLDQALWTVSCSIGRKKCEMWKKGKVIYLWADGICICQNNNEEKSNKVAMMGDIYRTARPKGSYWFCRSSY